MSFARHHPPRGVEIQVGNTYRRLPAAEARYDRSGRRAKVHDWTLYLDVVRGDEDLVERVTFDLGSTFSPREFTCRCPVPVVVDTNNSKDHHGGSSTATTVMRFCTRQQSYGSVEASIRVVGVGGTVQTYQHRIALESGGNNSKSSHREWFTEDLPPRPFRLLKMPPTVKYGIELELTSTASVSAHHVADRLCSDRRIVRVANNYQAGRETCDEWKLVPDSSIECLLSQPDCNTFELVSPVLMGGDGLQQTNQIMQCLGSFSPDSISVNKSMGFHVHVDVSEYDIRQLVKICQNFIKYEDAMDSFMPPSRRTGSDESDLFFRSNRASVGSRLTNAERHAALGACDDVESLAWRMNRGRDEAYSRHYKLNLQNLVSGRQPTLEFRQHSATSNYEKISHWIRFCTAFCSNSAKLQPPRPFGQSRGAEEQFQGLFHFCIKDRALRNFYRDRARQLMDEAEQQTYGTFTHTKYIVKI